jgi:N-acetylglucosaminyldiphosphoundecaprenol N-acetyl-beta-D-mannosaminyltransferase
MVFNQFRAADAAPPPAPVTELRRRRLDLGGVLVDQVDPSLAVERLRGFLASGRPHQVATVNLDFVSIAGRQAAFRAAINRAELAVADGMPLVWLSRLRGRPLAARITGHELVEACCRLAAETGRGVFLLGAAPGVAAAAARELEARHPGLRVVGTYSPPFGPLTAAEDARMVRMVREAAPGFLFVALGPPRQELWIRAYLEELGVPVAMGVGCVLDVLAGEVRRAPGWAQRAGLEWACRLAQEPRRLWKRYVLDDVPTLGRLVLEAARERRGAAAAGPRAAMESVG